MKRCLDIVLALLALAILAPLLLLIALLVRMTMGAPIFFRQQRSGLNGRSFEMLKFRTMRDGLETDALRLTRFGRFLRAYSIDELPELWNVLRGDMSIVGPRPLLTSYMPLYSPHQARRHEIRPGLTGLAQVKGRNAIAWEEKFALDVWYVDHRSLLLDFWIIALTAVKVFRRSGINAEGDATMPRFTGSGRA